MSCFHICQGILKFLFSRIFSITLNVNECWKRNQFEKNCFPVWQTLALCNYLFNFCTEGNYIQFCFVFKQNDALFVNFCSTFTKGLFETTYISVGFHNKWILIYHLNICIWSIIYLIDISEHKTCLMWDIA